MRPLDDGSSPPNGPAGWPLLSLLGTRAVFYQAGRALTHRFAPMDGRGRIESLEDGEARLARGKSIHPGEFAWQPADQSLTRFLNYCREQGLAAGGLRLHTLVGDDIPLEALPGFTDEELIVLRLAQSPFETHAATPRIPDSEPAQKQRVRALIYFNPGEEPELPYARAESLEIAELLEGKCDDLYIARCLDEGELREHMTWADLVFYFGHGENIAGAPAVPSPTGWIPLCAAGISHQAIFFSACYRGPSRGLRFPGGCALFPVCRLADRETGFLRTLVEHWLAGDDLPAAYGRAIRRDALDGDMRRFVFQLQGLNEIASRTGLFP